MSERAKQLVAQLLDFRTRKAAMNSLVALGDEAVPALVETLGSRHENVRWCARNVLIEIGSDAAVEQLIAALDDPRRRQEAVAALREITGEQLPDRREQWEAWRQGAAAVPEAEQPQASPAPTTRAQPPPPTEAPEAEPPRPLSDEELVKAAVEGTEIKVEPREGGFSLTVPLEGGRHQEVTVAFRSKDFEGEPLVVVYTECGPASPKNYEWALRQNLRMSFGAIGIRDRHGQPTFVMLNTHARATVSPVDLHKSVILLARKADAIEAALTKEDRR